MEYDSIFLKHTKRMMLILGIWPEINASYWKRTCYKIFSTMLLVNYGAFVLSLGIGLKYALNLGPLEQADVIQNILLYILMLWKMLLTTTRVIRKLMREMSAKEKHILNSKNDAIKDMYMRNVRYNYKMFFAVMGLIVFGLMQFFLISYWETVSFLNNPDRRLVLTQWVPYNLDKHFLETHYFQIFNRFYGGSNIMACDPLFFSFIYFSLTRLKLLGRNLAHFQECCNENESKAPDNILRELILEHKDIIRYIEELNNTMKWYFFMDFLVRSYHISLVLFKIMVLNQSGGEGVGQAMEVAFSITYLSVLLLQMLIMYYHANELRLESMEISSYIFRGNWYDQPLSCKNSFLIMMLRSQRPMELHIGNLNTITADLIVKVFKAGYTYVLLSKQ